MMEAKSIHWLQYFRIMTYPSIFSILRVRRPQCSLVRSTLINEQFTNSPFRERLLGVVEHLVPRPHPLDVLGPDFRPVLLRGSDRLGELICVLLRVVVVVFVELERPVDSFSTRGEFTRSRWIITTTDYRYECVSKKSKVGKRRCFEWIEGFPT